MNELGTINKEGLEMINDIQAIQNQLGYENLYSHKKIIDELKKIYPKMNELEIEIKAFDIEEILEI